MAQIMIKCPLSNHAIPTGMDVESDAEFNGLVDVAYHVDCPSCGFNHAWFKHDAWIEERPEPKQLSPHTRSRAR